MAIPALERNIWLTSPMMRGDDVLMVQSRLAAAGARLTQDGLYGRGTRAAVEEFQRSRGLLADGVVGSATWSRLMGPLDGTSAPAAPAPSTAAELIDLARLTTPHRVFQGSVTWSLGPDGISVDDGRTFLAPSPQERKLVADVLTNFRQALATALGKFQVPVELVVACICTESSGQPQAKRMEPGCDTIDPSRTPSRVSWGLTQTLLSTGREVLRQPGLRLEELLDPEVSIRAGAAFMWLQGRRTGFDPPLVAAAYNAGSLRWNGGPQNPWKLLQFPIGTGAHVDRFCRFFNAAMTTDAPLPDHVPSLRALLGGQPARTVAPQPPAAASPPLDPSALTTAQLQELLRNAGAYAGPADGLEAQPFLDAMEKRLGQEANAGHLASGWEGWSASRRRFAVEQSLIRDAGIEVGEIDGLVGPQTTFARKSFQHVVTTGQPLLIPGRDDDPPQAEPAMPAAQNWPRQSLCNSVYGEVGQNQTVLMLPYRMRLAWNPGQEVNRFSCHEKVHDAFLRVFQKTLGEYGEARISDLGLDLFGGCLNVRRMRGGTRMSMHSWGIAVDLDPARNALEMTRDAAAFARPEYEPFWKIVEGEGLVALGRVRNFDWMHFQAARL